MERNYTRHSICTLNQDCKRYFNNLYLIKLYVQCFRKVCKINNPRAFPSFSLIKTNF